MILHIDCNTFYASCEVSLRPDLIGKPVVVANCNEAGGGIILALTKEAKALGLRRGNPVFQVKDILNRHQVAVFPANLPKYVDISRRLMQVVRDLDMVVDFRQYSIDEFFGELPLNQPDDLRDAARHIKAHVERCTGIPVSCGISSTYTLAKIATWYSKHYVGYQGVCVLPDDKVEVALQRIPIAEIWGIGRRTAPRLEGKGITTALQFYQKKEFEVQKLLNINGVKTWKELHGVPSVDIDSPARQKSIVHSRTFAYMTSDPDRLHRYIANYAVAVARKLRDQHSVCKCVSVFINTNPHRDDLEQYGNFATVNLDIASADTMAITNAASRALDSIFRPGYQYKRAGVMLTDITGDDAIQLGLFSSSQADIEKSRRLMDTLDRLTTRYGMDAVRLASQGFDRQQPDLNGFQPSKNETTNIDDIIEVH